MSQKTAVLRRLSMLVIYWAMLAQAWAASPRWVAGPPWQYVTSPMGWRFPNVQYWVDQGPLSSSVNHDAAEAMVAAAAAPWNVPSATVTLTKGGALDEDVNSTNVFLGQDGPIWPPDVQPSNGYVKNIALIFDTDGTITDMLLGAGASDPANCRQNAVTESVDWFVQPGKIGHALVFLNGRCTGPAPEMQLQMQYQLLRVFGRVLGIGWSQTNDNVFTGSPVPTYQQQMHWPIMHPIEILCGQYTYQCLPSPFQLRDDDVAALGLVYRIGPGEGAAGKDFTLAHAVCILGMVTFPNGDGMAGVNMVARRTKAFTGITEPWDEISSVTGYAVRAENGNPVTGPVAGFDATVGTTDRSYAGYFNLAQIPIPDSEMWEDFPVTMQPINPLYAGAYAVGPYASAAVLPSGPMGTQVSYTEGRNGTQWLFFAAGSDATQCTQPGDGTETAAAGTDTTGMWSGRLCGFGHAAWRGLTVQAGRTVTVEVTALDEYGNASSVKGRPVMGLWGANDPAGTLPTVAASPDALNGSTNGLTQVSTATTTTGGVRLAIVDTRSEGRPDFGYRARVLYADSVTPSTLTASGGTIHVRGMGFKTGNTVTVGGVNASVVSWTPNEIVATVPALTGSKLQAKPKDVAVTDLATGGSTTIRAGLTMGAGTASSTLLLLGAPTGNVVVGTAAAQALVVRLVDGTGVPVSGALVTLSVTSGGVMWGACGGAATCSMATDGNGIVSSVVTARAAGTVTLRAAVVNVPAVTAQFSARDTMLGTAVRALQYVAAGVQVQWTTQVAFAKNGASVAGQAVQWTASQGTSLQSGSSITDGGGQTQMLVTTGPLQAGVQAGVQACAWTTTCVSVLAQGVGADEWRMGTGGGAGQVVSSMATLAPVTVQVTDTAGHGVAGAPVTIHQTVEGWQAACPASGRCPIAPVYGQNVTNDVSDSDGKVIVPVLQYAGTAAVTKIVVATGTQGYVAMEVEKTP